MKLYSYIVKYDIGFAPNPFHGWCTLATCKPGIRKGASIGDWIVGVGSKQSPQANHLIYAMRVEEILSFDDYWLDRRFERKKPDRQGSTKYLYGDNIYHRGSDGKWNQEDSRHSLDTGQANPAHVKRDTSAPKVLASRHFWYWGSHGQDLPSELRNWEGVDLCSPGRSYSWKQHRTEMINALERWLETQPTGVSGEPADWAPRRRRPSEST